jgi:hypothetical protein
VFEEIKNEIYHGNPDGFVREKLNCPFYPACYIMGDCDFDDWKIGNCGLPQAEKHIRTDKWMEDLRLRSERSKLGQKLKSLASQGKLDELLEVEW